MAADGSEALRKLKNARPTIILLDTMMPGLTGFAVCRVVTDDPDLNKAYGMMLTARGRVAEQDGSKEKGAKN